MARFFQDGDVKGDLTFLDSVSVPDPTDYAHASNKDYVDGVVGKTTSDITFPVDYNDGTAIDPPPGTVFYSQADLDAWLTDEGVTNIKHLQAAWDALPATVNGHLIIFNCAAGIHRPQSGLTTTAWNLTGRTFVGDAYAAVSGVGASSWGDLSTYAALSVVAYTGDGSNPALQITGATFTPGELKGRYLRVDNSGQVSVIHDNTADTIYILDNISPAATAVSVKEWPATIFRNSQTDVVGAGQCSYAVTLGSQTNINNATIDPWNKAFGNALYLTGNVEWGQGDRAIQYVMVDTAAYYEITGGPAAFGITNGLLVSRSGDEQWQALFNFTTRPPPKALDDNGFVVQSGITGGMGSYSYGGNFFYGYNFGAGVSGGGVLQTTNSVFDSHGGSVHGSSFIPALIDIYEESTVGSPNWTYGKQFEIRNCFNPPTGDMSCVRVRSGAAFRPGLGLFSNNECTCINVGADGIVGSGTERILNGSVANQDWGIEVVGPRASVQLGPLTDVSGTSGEIQKPDGGALTYADLKANSPVTDLNTFTIMQQET